MINTSTQFIPKILRNMGDMEKKTGRTVPEHPRRGKPVFSYNQKKTHFFAVSFLTIPSFSPSIRPPTEIFNQTITNLAACAE
jgi:hypothetical protein